jgi:GNAT superfamily N-acetyltransferase
MFDTRAVLIKIRTMSAVILVRPIGRSDYAGWRPLWEGYNRFYGRHGSSALCESISEATWERFFSRQEPVNAFVAEQDGRLVGIAHYLFHRSTTRITDVCYLQDLFTAQEARGRGIGRQLILAVYEAARAAGSSRVYWQTKVTNAPGRALYDKVADHQGFIVYTHEL